MVTVCGPILPEQMGVTLSHDHILLDAYGMWGTFTGNYSVIMDDEDVATREVAQFKVAGGGTICDPTNIGIGQQPRT